MTLWNRFWMWILFHSFRVGNFRVRQNRFTGEFTWHAVHPMARLPVQLSDKQRETIKELVKDGHTEQAQQEVLDILKKQDDIDCFSCKAGEKMPSLFIATDYGYPLCQFHADMAMVVGWKIEPIVKEQS